MKRWIHNAEDVDDFDEYDPYHGHAYRIAGGLSDSKFEDDPVRAITQWFRLGKKYPMDTAIMAKTKSDAVKLCKAATADLLDSLNAKYGCPYKIDYLIDEAAKKVADGQKYFHEDKYGYGDQVHPFGVG